MGSFVCGASSRCITLEDQSFKVCNGDCISYLTPCDNVCPSETVSCGDECVMEKYYPSYKEIDGKCISIMCQTDDDCQENARCFADELNSEYDGMLLTVCHCFLEFYLDKSTVDLPKTGTCVDLRTESCDTTSKEHCIEDEEGGFCPYCRGSSYYYGFLFLIFKSSGIHAWKR